MKNPDNPNSQYFCIQRAVFAAMLVTSVMVGGCSGETILTPGEEISDSFEESFNKWHELNYKNYSFEFRWECFCTHSPTWVRISVNDSIVTRVQEVESGTVYEDELEWKRNDYQTIDQLFQRIKDAYDAPADRITGTYDKETGFPIDVRIAYNAMADDEELRFHIRKVTVHK